MAEIYASDRFSGRLALVTGAAGAIGAATAARLGREGAALLLSDRDATGLARVEEQLRAEGVQVTAIACDQSSPDEVAALFAAVPESGIDICFANAGWGRTDPILTMDPKLWKRAFDINVYGTFLICQAAARSMASHGRGGSIIITASTGAQQPAALFSAYCSAKAALNMLAKVMALELGAFDIRVNTVMPGVTETAMTDGLLQTRAKDLCVFETPMGRLGQPEDVAGAVAFLASDDSRYISGTSLLIDGGSLLNGVQWFSTDFRVRGETDWRLRHERVRLDADAQVRVPTNDKGARN